MKRILLILLIIISAFLPEKTVKADDKWEYPCHADTGWSFKTITGPLDGTDIKISKFYNNYTERFGFCIEPDVYYTPCNGTYTKSNYYDYRNEGIAKIADAFLELGASDDLYIAAQLMIWELYGNRQTINGDAGYNYGRSSIEEYINSHYCGYKPALNSLYEVPYNNEYSITDSSGLIDSRYNVSSDTLDISKEGNSIFFTVDSIYPTEHSILLDSGYDIISALGSSTYLYTSFASQNIYTFESSYPVVYTRSSVKIRHESGSLHITKYDEYDRLVKDKIFIHLYDENNNEIFKEDGSYFYIENGYLNINNILPPGDYFLTEQHHPKFVDNDTEYHFEINKNEITELIIQNTCKEIDLTINKIDELNNPVDGTEFELYEITDDIGLQFDSTILTTPINKQYYLDNLMIMPLDDEEISLEISERYRRYIDNNILTPKEYGYFEYKVFADNIIIDEDKIYVTDQNDYISSVIDAKLIYKGKTSLNRCYSISLNELSEYELFLITDDIETPITIEEIKDFDYGVYKIKCGNEIKELEIKESVNLTINNLKTNHRYLLIESNPKKGYVYDESPIRVIDTYENLLYYPINIINCKRDYNLRLIKNNNESLPLNGAVFNIRLEGMEIDDGKLYVTGGKYFVKDEYDYLHIKDAENNIEVITMDSDYVYTNTKDGKYSYYYSNDSVSDPDRFINYFDIKQGELTINDLPYDKSLLIKEIKAPVSYYIDNGEYLLKPDIPYSKLTLENTRINNAVIMPGHRVVKTDVC